MPLRVTLDHLMFGLVVAGLIWSLKAVLSVAEICNSMMGAALESCSWVTLRPVVSIMFPLLVHLTDERWTATWAEVCRWELMDWQSLFKTISCCCSEVMTLLKPRTRLGLARAAALALYVGWVSCPLPWADGLLVGGTGWGWGSGLLPFGLRPLTVFVSELKVDVIVSSCC